jgi:CHAT domain-containing protein
LEYVLADSIIYVFAISNQSYHLSTISNDIERIVSEINKLRLSFENVSLLSFNENNIEEFKVSSYYLYSSLIKPIKSHIRSNRLIIIPDAEINYLSFDMIISDTINNSENFRELNYLLNQYIISYAGSAKFLIDGQNNLTHTNNPKVLAFAPTYGDKQIVQQIKNIGLRESLYPLLHVEKEVQNITGIIEGQKLSGFEATESAFKNKAHNFDIVHLAMHTIIDDSDPMYSKLVFYINNDTVDDGFLHAYELYNLKLNSQLAVLSACNTGLGKLEKGEGVISIARAFFYAGVPSIVMTLWPVEDQQGPVIMTSFYKNLKNGQPKDFALNNAKKEYLLNSSKLNSHPYFWASYVVIGNNNEIVQGNKSLKTICIFSIIISVFLFLVIGRWVFIRKKR